MKRIATLILTGAIAVSAAAPAWAQTETGESEVQVEPAATEESTELIDLKEWANTAIAHRLQTIAEARVEVNAAEHITSAHASALLSDLAAAEGNLNGLSKEVADAEHPAEVWGLLGRIAEETRVYVVLIPKVIGVSVSDAAVVVADEIDKVGAEIQEAINAADAWGLDVSDAQALLDDALDQSEDARTIAQPVAERLLALKPADFPATSVRVVEAATVDLEEAFGLLESSGTDLFAAFETLVRAFEKVDK